MAIQLPVDKIAGVMTNNQNWEQDGLGKSGETFFWLALTIRPGCAPIHGCYCNSLKNTLLR